MVYKSQNDRRWMSGPNTQLKVGNCFLSKSSNTVTCFYCILSYSKNMSLCLKKENHPEATLPLIKNVEIRHFNLLINTLFSNLHSQSTACYRCKIYEIFCILGVFRPLQKIWKKELSIDKVLLLVFWLIY